MQTLVHTLKIIIGNQRRKSEILTTICQKYLREDQISLVLSIVFILIIMLVKKEKRFSHYIHKTYARFMESKFYKDKIKKAEDEEEENVCCSEFSSLACACDKSGRSLFCRIKNSLFKRILPISPFCSHDILETIAIYVIYTYDILNIFTYVYSSFLVIPIFKMLRNKGGILLDFIFQIIHVLMIGFKFYPLLVIRDIEETWITNSISFIYTLVLWILKLLNKGLCSRTEVFIQSVLNNLNKFENKSREKVDQFNLTNLVTVKADLDELVYKDMIQAKIPSLFNETFKSVQNDDNLLWFKSTTQINSSPEYSQKLNISRPTGFRKINTGFEKLQNSFDDIYQDENPDWTSLIRGLLENFPLYLSISYLLASYSVSLFYIIKKKFQQSNTIDAGSLKLLRNEFSFYKSDYQGFQRTGSKCNICMENYYKREFVEKNKNYIYIKAIIIKKSTPERKIEKNVISNEFNDDSLVSISAHRDKNKIKTKTETNDGEKMSGHIQYSKQFIYTYTVAFMIVYFFTVFLFRVSNLFGGLTEKIVELLFRILFKNELEKKYMTDWYIMWEFRTAYVTTSIISMIQLIQSINAFNARIQNLSTTNKDSFFLLKSSARSNVVRKSLHFSGYLVAHLVYGYIILLFFILLIILLIRIVIEMPSIFFDLIQFILPIVLMIMLKSVFIRSIIASVIKCKSCRRRQTPLTAYSTLSYFNFFFDCFLGFMSCINRIWKTTVISIFYVIRLDVSLFNEKNSIILKSLDKGHVAFINFSIVEHSYNHPIINGFCEVLTESLFQSFIHQYQLQFPKCDCDKQENNEKLSIMSDEKSAAKHKLAARLRSIIYLREVLKSFPKLRRELRGSNVMRNNQNIFETLLKNNPDDVQHQAFNFIVMNQNLIDFFKSKTNNRNHVSHKKFTINSKFNCIYINSDSEKKTANLLYMRELVPFLPKNNPLIEIKFLNCNKIDQFLFAVWLSCKDLSVLEALKLTENETYNQLAYIVGKINEGFWHEAKYLWLVHIGKITESLDKIKRIECREGMDYLFISKMKLQQCYKQIRKCDSCEIVDDNIFGSELMFEKIGDKVCLRNFENVKEDTCDNNGCKGKLNLDKTVFDPIPILICTEFSFKCTHKCVPVVLTAKGINETNEVRTCSYKLICCILNDDDKSLFYINEAYYLYNTLKPGVLERRIDKENSQSVLCAIYAIINY